MNIGQSAAKRSDISSSATTLLNHLFQQADSVQASDIHFDSTRTSCCIFFRIQGLLKPIFSPPTHLMPALINRLKIMAKLNIADHKLPQEGQLELPLPDGRLIEARLSTIPTFFGEKASIRLFSPGPLLSLNDLGLEDSQLRLCLESLQKTTGLILIAGPTGSGKTTTLYAMLNALKNQGKHLISIENPVERSLQGVNQISVNDHLGLSFERLVSACLRHDPDVLMIGEIRDTPTAKAVIQAAETGHLVLSTIHAGSSYEVFLRLLHLGIEQHFLASTVLLVIQQRLLPHTHISKLLGIFECLPIHKKLRHALLTENISHLESSFETNLNLKTLATQAYESGQISQAELGTL